MHDDDIRTESADPDQVESTPIGQCTLDEIVAHLKSRFGSGIIAIQRSPVWVSPFEWGSVEMREVLLAVLTPEPKF